MVDFFSNGRVGIDEDSNEVASPEYAFGTGMLSYIDSLFFYIPFASASQADKARSEANDELEVWERHRNNLRLDHEADGAREELKTLWNSGRPKFQPGDRPDGSSGARVEYVPNAAALGGEVIGEDD